MPSKSKWAFSWNRGWKLGIRRLVWTLTAAVALHFVWPGISMAASRNFHGAVVITTTTSLNLRGAPGGNVIGKLSDGTRLTVFGREGSWIEVATANGTRGWVHADYLAARLSGYRIAVDPGHGGYDGGGTPMVWSKGMSISRSPYTYGTFSPKVAPRSA